MSWPEAATGRPAWLRSRAARPDDPEAPHPAAPLLRMQGWMPRAPWPISVGGPTRW